MFTKALSSADSLSSTQGRLLLGVPDVLGSHPRRAPHFVTTTHKAVTKEENTCLEKTQGFLEENETKQERKHDQNLKAN